MTLDLETARLRIRGFVEDDWLAVHEYLSAPGMRRFVPEWPETPEGTREFVGQNLAGEARQYALVLRDGDRVIGHVAFHPWFGPRTYEIGWAVAPEHQGSGYATEAGRALLDYAFTALGVHRVIATCETGNEASARVMEKLGMRREAHFRQCYLREDGTWSDEYFYALLADEWPPADG